MANARVNLKGIQKESVMLWRVERRPRNRADERNISGNTTITPKRKYFYKLFPVTAVIRFGNVRQLN